MNKDDLKTLLSRIEWSEYRWGDGQVDARCPYCIGDGDVDEPGGFCYHEIWCKLAAFMVENGVPVHIVISVDEDGEVTKQVDPHWAITE